MQIFFATICNIFLLDIFCKYAFNLIERFLFHGLTDKGKIDMQKVLLLAGVACFAATTASAFDFNPYISAKAKYAFARNEIKATGSFEGKDKINDDLWGGSVAVGTIYNLMNGDFRFELEYTKNADAKDKNNKVKTQGVLFNVYYDFDLKTTVPVKPYVGVGLGWGQTKLDYRTKHIKDDGASMQIGAGVNYKINENIALDLGYRYITYGDFDEEYHVGPFYEKIEYRPRAHEILLGVRYEF